MISAISLSRQWSVQALYDYARDHLERQFANGQIHPAIILGVARQHGIPDLIRPAVEALANQGITYSSWSTDPTIICHLTVVEMGVVGRMKEKLQMARGALCNPPRIVHDEMACPPSNTSTCAASWKRYWALHTIPKLLGINGEMEHSLLQIQEEVVSTGRISGMVEECKAKTIADSVVGMAGWSAEQNIPEGAIGVLMVLERVMLTVADDA